MLNTEKENDRNVLWIFVGSVAASLVLYYVPYGRFALYPISFVTTWAHEIGHGIAAILVGGEFQKLEIYQSLGGTAFMRIPARGFAPVFVAFGGLIGPSIAGGVVIWLSKRKKAAPRILMIFGGILIVSAIAVVRNPFGFAVTLLIGVIIISLSRHRSKLLSLIMLQIIAIQLCLNSLSNIDYLFTKEFVRNGRTMASDTQAIAEVLLLPYWFWGILIATLSILILGSAFYFTWLRPYRLAIGKQKHRS